MTAHDAEARARARREETQAWISDHANRMRIELGSRVELALVNENHEAFSAEWRAEQVSARAWEAMIRRGRS